ncbi:acyltransferase [Joostella atrarenae]|uniref:Acyltransferase n=1 Tax=Joostella atrarenae TaxID=679257 RepID=A0ABS9J4J6_9FLAO|nr:acyltransferase [Joostella atrarenae]MCF8715340.1 acyltransferase [Joostella atrarenae]
MTSEITPKKSKKHFIVLDGLRGVAALAVVIFHFMEWIYTDFTLNFIGHGFLAVDFFFCLSGFVIAYAYDDRIADIGILKFFKSRIIRLHPLVIFGSVLGLLLFFLDPFDASEVTYSFLEMGLIFLCSLLLIPYPVMGERGFNNFGLNAPSWSLFWEYIANIAYALFLNKLKKPVLIVLTIIAAGFLSYVAYNAGNLMGGWSKDNFWDGFARISYSFLAGILIYRCNWIIKNNLGFIGLSLLIAGAFLMPYFSFNWLYELLCVLIYFPLLIMLGAGTIEPVKTKRLCVFSGKISYPLYMTHYAGIWVFGNYLIAKNPSKGELTFIVIGGTILFLIVAYFVMTYFDEPVRKYLKRRFR